MLERHIDRDAWPMALGDIVVLTLVFASGTVRHNGLNVLWTEPLYSLATIAPFLIGWAVAAPLLGAYRPRTRTSLRWAVVPVVPVWVVANALALGLRVTPWLHGGVSPVFALVTLVTGAGGLVLWRVVFGLARARWVSKLR